MKNIIVFFNDDHGQWALPSYGNKDIWAPNIDYLSDNGVQFNNSFTPTPVCSPSRASFFTGLRASDHGVHDFIGEPGRDKDWLKDFNTLPSLLKTKFNYDTSIFGKWHLGQDDKKRSYFNHWFVEKGVYPFSHKMSHSFKENNTSKEIYGFRDQIITEKFNDTLPIKFENGNIKSTISNVIYHNDENALIVKSSILMTKNGRGNHQNALIVIKN